MPKMTLPLILSDRENNLFLFLKQKEKVISFRQMISRGAT